MYMHILDCILTPTGVYLPILGIRTEERDGEIFLRHELTGQVIYYLNRKDGSGYWENLDIGELCPRG